MADDGSTQSTSVWPLPKFYFQVKWDSEVMSFQEVSSSRELQFLGTITFDESLLDNDNNRDMVGQ